MSPKELKVVFGDKYRIDVEYKGYVIKTDQPVRDGGTPRPLRRSIISWPRSPPAPASTPWPSAASARSPPTGWA